MRRFFALFLFLTSLFPAAGITVAQESAVENTPPVVSREEALDSLFAELATTRDPRKAANVRQQIWDIWLHSGSPTVDLIMSRSVDAIEKEQLTHALELLDALVVLAPDFAEAWNKRATVLYYLGEPERSLADIGQTLQKEPRHFGALSGLAMILEDRKEHDKAAIVREKIRVLSPLLPNLDTLRLSP